MRIHSFDTVKEAFMFRDSEDKKHRETIFSIPYGKPCTVKECSIEEYVGKTDRKRDRSGESNKKVHWADLPEYISPITGRPVDGRAERREEMKRHGCREVDTSEFKPVYRNERFMKKRGFVND